MNSNSRKRIRHEDYRRCETDFQLELARGASFIASSMTRETLQRSIDETVREFSQTHGATDAFLFCNVLADRLSRRGRADAVAILKGSSAEGLWDANKALVAMHRSR